VVRDNVIKFDKMKRKKSNEMAKNVENVVIIISVSKRILLIFCNRQLQYEL